MYVIQILDIKSDNMAKQEVEQIQIDADKITVKEWRQIKQERDDKVAPLRAELSELYASTKVAENERDQILGMYKQLKDIAIERGVLRSSQFGILMKDLEKSGFVFRSYGGIPLAFEKLMDITSADFKPMTRPHYTPYERTEMPTQMYVDLLIKNDLVNRPGFSLDYLLGLLDEDGNLIKNPKYMVSMRCYNTPGFALGIKQPLLYFEDDPGAHEITGYIDRNDTTEERITDTVAEMTAIFDKIAAY
jgi:hypothetical protein